MALSKKLWNNVLFSKDLPHLKETALQEIKTLFPESTKYEKRYVTDLLVTETDEGTLTGVRFYFWVKDPQVETYEGYGVCGGYVKLNDKIIFKILESEDEAKEMGTTSNRPVYRKLDKEIESVLNKSAQVEIPTDLLKKIAPQIQTFEVPEAVKDEKERDGIMKSLLSLWSGARSNFLELLPKSSQSLVGAEIDPSRILTKRGKNSYSQAFFEKVAPSFVDVQNKIKNIPRDRKKEIKDEASGYSVGDKVEFVHPTYGKISGTVAVFKDGKVGVRHKNYSRQNYYSMGTEVTFLDASELKYIGNWKGPSTPASQQTIKEVETALKKITNGVHNEIVTYFENLIAEQIDEALLDLKNVSKHRQTMIDDLQNKKRRLPTELEREKSRIEMMKNHEIQWNALKKYHERVKKYFEETSSETLDVVKNLKQMVTHDAETISKNMESTFVDKQLSKLSSIIDKRKDFSSVVIKSYKFAKGVLEADLKCNFGDDSFVVHTILVYAVSPQGTGFYRYPTTFHDVVLDGTNFKKVDERWMNEIFAKKVKKEAQTMNFDFKNFDLDSYCQKLVEFVRAGRITKKQQVHQILATGRVTPHQFVDWFFDALGKVSGKSRTTYDDLAKLIDMDVFPRTFAIRKLDYVDKMNWAPKSFQEKYAAVHHDIDTLAQKLSRSRRKNP